MTLSVTSIRGALETGNPIIHVNRATLIWEGEFAPYLISDLSDWEVKPKPFKRVPASFKLDRSLWSCSLTVPQDAYVEYAFYNPLTREKSLDPLNPHTVSNGIGSRNNFFYMPENTATALSVRRAEVQSGRLTHYRVDADFLEDDSVRDVYLYKPPTNAPVPLLIVYDGYDYLRRAKLATVVDNLIAEKRIHPIGMAFLQNGRSRRSVEYFCSDATLLWLDHAILPLARQHLRLINIERHPGAYGVLGSSAGGLMAFYTGLRMPETFGKVLCQSGVFSLDGRDLAVVDLVQHSHARDIKIWMDVGTLDELLEDNREMIALLDKRQYNVIYREFSAGHNYTAWRNDIWRGLEEMFPGPSR
jgi:enterochelin esterase-like enzyme